jgi:hypothetical protein
MGFLPRTNISTPISPRQPEKKSLLDVVQKELWPWLLQAHRAVNWVATWVGLIQVDPTDTPGTLAAKTAQGSGVTITKTGVDGARQLTFSADTAAIVTNIITNPVTVQTITNVVTNTVQASPGQVASTLYPALISDPLNRGAVVGIADTSSANWSDGWTAAGGISTWTGIFDFPLVYLDGITPIATGDVFWIGGTSDGSDWQKHRGVYEMLQVGVSGLQPPVIRRISTANTSTGLCHGMTVQITGNVDGNGDQFQYISITTADPITVDVTPIAFSVSGTHTFADRYELLTGPQLASEGASSSLVDIDQTMASGDADMQAFGTIAGTPGLSALPAGMWTFDNELVYLHPLFPPSAGSATVLRWRILKEPGATELFHADSPPVTLVPGALSFQYNDTGHSLSPTDTLVAIPSLHTNSTTPVQLWLRAQSASRLTRITAPLTLPVSLTATRSIYVPAGQLTLDGAALKTHAYLGPLGQRTDSVALPHAASTNGVSLVVKIPWDKVGGAGFMVRPLWSPGYTGSGAVMWAVSAQAIPAGSILTPITPTQQSGDAPGFTLGVPYLETGISTGAFSPAAGTFMRIEVFRVGGSGGDTYIGDANLLGLQIDYIASAGDTLPFQAGPPGPPGATPSVSGTGWWHSTSGTLDGAASTPTATQVGAEPGLGNPGVDGYVLSSTVSGTRSWVAQTGGGGGSANPAMTEYIATMLG